MGKYIGQITDIIDQSDYKINCIFETPGSPDPITFSGFPVPLGKPLTLYSPVYIEGNWSQHKKLGSVIKGMIRHIDDYNLPKIKKATRFNQEKFLNDLQHNGIRVSARTIQD